MTLESRSTSEIMKDFGQGTAASNFTLLGAAVAELTVKALKHAGPEPDPGELD